MEVRSDTDGLASAYQMMEVTAGGPPVLETGGNLFVGVITFPHSEPLPLTPVPPEMSTTEPEQERETGYSQLALEMTETPFFQRLVERGLADLDRGCYKELKEIKRSSGVL